jgi:hypothetical protein
MSDQLASEARLRAMAQQMNVARGLKDREEGWEFFDSMGWSADRLNPADQERLRSILREDASKIGPTSIESSLMPEYSERIHVTEGEG